MKNLKGFAISWFFAPYIGSADLDFFKRIKNLSIDFDVVQVRRDVKDDKILKYASNTIRRFEVDADHNHPRTNSARKHFQKEAVRIYEQSEENYDFIISHSNELISHQAALEIKRNHNKMPWIAYFGDLFIKNPYIKYIPGYPLVAEDSQIERDALKYADRIIVNNKYQMECMLAGGMEMYRKKVSIVPHCFDSLMYPEVPEKSQEKYIFSHLGTLYHTKRTAEPVLRAVDRLLEIYPSYKNKFEVIFYGGSPYSHDISVHAFMRHRNHVRFEEPVSYAESLKIMQRSNALIVIDGLFSEKEDGMTFNPFLPGKIADYMGAKKPILSITMKEGATADVMRETGNLMANENVDRIAYVLKRHIDGKVAPNLEAYDSYSIASIAPQMESAIRSVL